MISKNGTKSQRKNIFFTKKKSIQAEFRMAPAGVPAWEMNRAEIAAKVPT